MNQTRLGSFLEANANTAAGLVVSFGAGFVVYPLFGHAFQPVELVGITAIFTVLSIARGYAVRRLFNWIHHGK